MKFTPEQVIEMAREAGFPFNKFGLLQGDDDGEIDADKMLERLCTLAADRALEAAAAKAEAIARDEYGMVNSLHEYGECADAIRAMKEHQ